jgi:protein TonB
VKHAKVREVVEPKVKTDASARELQDEKSDVTGTSQASVVKPMQVGSEGQGDANATPFYKIKPKYPRPALIAGSEGWILMKIDVNEKGEVENVRIVGGEKRNLFQDEARRAVEQWKYRPFLDANGHAIRKADHQVRVDFKLNDTLAANST